MASRIPGHSNEAWIAALRGRGEKHVSLVRELTTYLTRVVGRAVCGQLDTVQVCEVVHESIRCVLEMLPRFRGDSAFTTWAAGIAIRVAFTELRRQYARLHMMGAFETLEAEVRRLSSVEPPPPDEALSHGQLLHVLEHAIATCLTERQQIAIMAELRGIPNVETARRLGTNSNALYKLTHDARRKLRQALTAAGFSAESIHMLATEVSPCP